MDIKDKVMKLEWELGEQFRQDAFFVAFEKSIAVTYFILKIKESGCELGSTKSVLDLCELLPDEEIRFFVYDKLKGIEQSLFEKVDQYASEVLKGFILGNMAKPFYENMPEECSTPIGICKLATKILDIQPGEKVLDNCLGSGTFLSMAYDRQPNADFFGIEINSSVAIIAKIRLSLLSENIYVKIGNALDTNFDESEFDKVFSDHPFGQKIRWTIDEYTLNKFAIDFPELSKGTSADWIYNYQLCSTLKKDGMGVTTMTLGGLWNTIDAPIRKQFLKQRIIKAIIKLPAKLYNTTAIPCALVVFGGQNDKIRFIDASNEYEEGRRHNSLTDNNVERICRALYEDSDISRTVTIEEIAENDFCFDPTRYLEMMVEVEDGVEFKTIIRNITRGASYSASELDELSSAIPTDFQYMMLGNVKNGLVDAELPYLKEIPAKFEKYCIHSGNILISKNGYPFKVAVAEPDPNKMVLANGNLYVIELDTDKVNPYYVKAYLDSEQGIAQLKRITVGAMIPNIGVAQLNTILIPLIPMEEQRTTAARCQALLDEIRLYRHKIEKAVNELKTVFSTKAEGND